MARKKRKAAPSAVPAKSAVPAATESTRMERILLPALGALALVCAWLAMLGGFSDGTLNIQDVFDYDTVRPWLWFRDLFLVEGYPPSGWRHGPAPYYVPDIALLFSLFGLGLGVRECLWLSSLLLPALAAGGWIAACERLFGKSPARRAAILLLHALALLLLGWGGVELFLLHAVAVYHYGTWALTPWLLWLLLRVLDADKKAPPFHPRNIAVFGALLLGLSAAVSGDLLALPHFIAPAVLGMLGLVFLKQMRGSEFLSVSAVLALSIPLGRGLHDGLVEYEARNTGLFTAPRLENLFSAPGNLLDVAAYFMIRHPLEFAVWMLFAAALAWRLFVVFRPRQTRSALFEAPRERKHLFVAMFAPASIAGALGAYYATGKNFPDFLELAEGTAAVNKHMRYVLPAVCLPLFAGWALLPWKKGLFRVRPGVLIPALALLVVLLSAPKALAIRAEGLDPFNTPFQRCFAKAANRLDWRGGISTFNERDLPAWRPAHGVEKMLPVGVLRRGAGQSVLYLDWIDTNRHYFDGAFDFVIVTGFNGRAFMRLPRGKSDEKLQCPMSELNTCVRPGARPLVLDEQSIRGAFGDPAEIVECEGVGLYHYDPPIQLDFSNLENPDGAPVGRVF